MGIPFRPEYQKKLPLYGMTIMVNPGHNVVKNGHFDFGSHGHLGKKVIREMDLNAKVAEDVRRKFEKLGANVIYVEKTPIGKIRDKENEIRPDLFIAIHHDAKAPGKHAKNSGETVYCWGPSKKVGTYINKEFKKDTSIPNNPNSESWASGLCVLKADSSINAVLVEVGFMSNPKELKLLNSLEYQDKAAQMIVDGSRKFLRLGKDEQEKMLKLKQEQEFKKAIFLFNPERKENFAPLNFTKNEGRDI